MTRSDFEVVVIGGGMVGATLACLLCREGFFTAIIEPKESISFDEEKAVGLRVSAISPGSASVLDHAGAWRIISGRRHCPYRRMRVEEGEESGAVAELDFAATEFGLERLGTIVENDSIVEALWQVLDARCKVGDPLRVFRPDGLMHTRAGDERVEVTLTSGRTISARLVVGADGARSAVRRFSGIEQDVWHYGQKGIVCVVRGTLPNRGTAWQRFMEGGPLAFLPLDDGSASIVWTRPDREADALLALEDDEFLAELQPASAGWLGELEWCGPRAAFDLTMRLSHRYAVPRVALVGDAAHVVHPLAGQGVNLGLLDVAALTELLVKGREASEEWAEHAPLVRTLEQYQRWRKSDAEVMARGIHGLRALFGPALLAPLRKVGLGMVARSWPAREAFLLRAAGLHADAPAMARAQR